MAVSDARTAVCVEKNQALRKMFSRGRYLVLTLPLSSADFCEGRETERE